MTILNTPGTCIDFIVTTVTIVTETHAERRIYGKMGKEKSVLIPEKLFVNLCRYHIFGITDGESAIRKGLEAKMDRFEAHQLYTTYKVSSDPEEKENARKKYLDKKGIHEGFRW